MTVAAYYLGVNVSWSEARLTDVVVQSCNQRPDLNWLAGCPSTVEAASCSSSDVLLDRHWEPTSGHDRGPHPNQLLFLVISVCPLTITSTRRRWREVFWWPSKRDQRWTPFRLVCWYPTSNGLYRSFSCNCSNVQLKVELLWGQNLQFLAKSPHCFAASVCFPLSLAINYVRSKPIKSIAFHIHFKYKFRNQ